MVLHFWTPESVQSYLFLANEHLAKVEDGYFTYKLCRKVHYRNSGDQVTMNNKLKSRVGYVQHETQATIAVNTLQNNIKYLPKLKYETDP